MASDGMEIKIKLLDQYGKPLDDLQKKVGNFGKANQKVNGDLHKSLSDLRIQLERYKEASEKSYRTDHIKKYNVLINETKQQIAELEKQTQSCGEKTEGLGSKFKSLTGISLGWAAVGTAIYKAGGFMADFSKAGIEADAQMQKYDATLKTMLGSTSAARDRMQEYMDIAKITPFDIQQVVESGNKLQALGRYSRTNLEMLGDLAAASGKDMETAMNAYSMLATGQKGAAQRMFRNLLITEDDWVKYTGKGVSNNGELLATTKEMEAALPKIMKAKGYLGMMATQADTTGGKMSNLKDAIFGLKAAVGERLRPATNDFLNISNKVVDKLGQWIGIPIEQKIAAEKAEVNYLMQSLIDAYPHEEKRQSLIDELNRKYPELLRNIDLEKTSTDELRTKLEEVNKQYDKKIRVATYGKMIENLEKESEKDTKDMANYQMSLLAKKRLKELEKEESDFLKSIGAKDDPYKLARIRNDGSVMYDYYDEEEDRMKSAYFNLTDEQMAKSRLIGAEKAANRKAANWSNNEPEKLKELELKAAVKQKQISAIQALIDGEEDGEEDGEGTGTSSPKTPLATDIDAAANSISSGGKQVKNFNIVINDGLIKQVDNHFASTNESPESAGDFMWQLSQALQMMLNDMNYAAR